MCKHILILDFGSQYTQLIVRRVREIGVYCDLQPWNIDENEIRQFNPAGIILSGGPKSVTDINSLYPSNYVFRAGIPVLGICYGMHVMVVKLGGNVEISKKREFGFSRIEICNSCELIDNIKDTVNIDNNMTLKVWMSHNDIITTVPKDFLVIARSKNCPFVIIANEKKKFYGVQFHPEVTHTQKGQLIIKKFVNICQCKPTWKSTNIISNIISNIIKKVGNDKVILALSGGIDSIVTAILLNRAIGRNLICIFVDNGLLRLNESKKVIKNLFNNFKIKVLYISAEDRFFNALLGINDPEIKRKIVSKTFIEIFNEEANKLNISWLAQGTIYPDIIESSTNSNISSIIKSHHNAGISNQGVKLKVIEPLKNLFKDEVRKIGLALGLPYEQIYQHPFPGPGFSIRILGEVKKEYCNLLRRADSIFIDELHRANLYNKLSQAFAVFLSVRSVGILGDNRNYDWVISLRAIETIDFMTARWANLPHDFLDYVSNRIINEVPGISRVVYDITNKPPATIEWE